MWGGGGLVANVKKKQCGQRLKNPSAGRSGEISSVESLAHVIL